MSDEIFITKATEHIKDHLKEKYNLFVEGFWRKDEPHPEIKFERYIKAPTSETGDVESINEYIFVDIIDGIYEAQENENTTLDISVDMAIKIIKEFRRISNQAAELSQKDKRIADLENACEIAIGYTSLVASGVKKIPILKDRAKSDTDIIEKALKGSE